MATSGTRRSGQVMGSGISAFAHARVVALTLVTLLVTLLPTGPLAQAPSSDSVTVAGGGAYPFSWVAPTRDVPFANRLTAGGVKTIKFSLGGNRGLGILAPISQEPAGGLRNGRVAPRSTYKTRPFGAAGLTYNRSSRTYSYAWQTREEWSNQCRVFLLKLDDALVHRALFRIFTFHFNPPTRRLPLTNVAPAGNAVPSGSTWAPGRGGTSSLTGSPDRRASTARPTQ